MWPHGWNSAWPGKPVTPYAARLGRTRPAPEEEVGNPQLWSRYLMEYEKNPSEVENQLKALQKIHLRRLLEWLSIKENADKPSARAMEMLLLDLLKITPQKRSRQYIQFLFGTPLADGCKIRQVLRDPNIYVLHPEPNVAASLRVCEAYTPQIGQRLLNYTSSSLVVTAEDEVEAPEQRVNEDVCPCKQALRHSLTEEEKKSTLIDGHVCTPWLKNLKWPYLQSIGKLGRKYRTALSVNDVLQSLREGLKSYKSWYLKKKGSTNKESLEKWAEAVGNKCQLNVDKAMMEAILKPDGYSGLVQQLTEAKELLTFVPDDRGPQIVHACCTKWYQRNLKKLMADARTYEKCDKSWNSILLVMNEQLTKYGFCSLKGQPYLYGIFKAKKRRWRPIVGITSRGNETADGERPRLTKILQTVMTSLKAKDMERIVIQSKRTYWIKESPQEIAAWIRQNLTTLAGRSMKVVDFKDMYTNIEHKLLLQRVEMAVDEALRWEHLIRGMLERVELGWNRTSGTYEVQSLTEEAVTILLKDDVIY